MAEHAHTTFTPAVRRRGAVPTPRTVRRAVDVLAKVGPEALADLAEAVIERLDAAERDLDLEEDNEDGCPAEDVPLPGTLGIGEADDAELNADDEEDDPQGDGDGEDEPNFPRGDPGTLRAERDGLVTVRRRLREIVVVKSTGGKPTGVATMGVRRFP